MGSDYRSKVMPNPYRPISLPIIYLNYETLAEYIGKANNAFGAYAGLLQAIPNPEIMLSPFLRREAVLSSKIEGTQATEDDLLKHEAGIEAKGEIRKDIQEIVNYRRALFEAEKYLSNRPISLSFICSLHKILLDSVRGKSKNPGKFRTLQNWIGNAGCTIDEATFVPPSPLQLQDYLQDWQSYLDSNDKDILLQTAIMHAQFELIHPFLDGNGRIGRILIPLFLYKKGILSKPMFYLSEYLENNRDEYYRRLQNISESGDWENWIIFFLEAIHVQATQNSNRVQKIMQFYDKTKMQIQGITHSQFTLYILEAIFNRPIFKISVLAEELHAQYGLHKKTTAGLLRTLRTANILEEVIAGRGSRSAVLSFTKLIEIAETGIEK